MKSFKDYTSSKDAQKHYEEAGLSKDDISIFTELYEKTFYIVSSKTPPSGKKILFKYADVLREWLVFLAKLELIGTRYTDAPSSWSDFTVWLESPNRFFTEPISILLEKLLGNGSLERTQEVINETSAGDSIGARFIREKLKLGRKRFLVCSYEESEHEDPFAYVPLVYVCDDRCCCF